MLFGRPQNNDPSIFLEEMELIDPDKTPMKRNSFGSAKGSYDPYSRGGRAYGQTRGSGGEPKLPPEVVDQIRRLNGLSKGNTPSRTTVRQDPVPKAPTKKAVNIKFSEGMRVMHPQFGRGTVKGISGTGQTSIVTIEFEKSGVRRLAAGYAPLTVITEG